MLRASIARRNLIWGEACAVTANRCSHSLVAIVAGAAPEADAAPVATRDTVSFEKLLALDNSDATGRQRVGGSSSGEETETADLQERI